MLVELPSELVLHVLTYLNKPELMLARMVCKRIQEIVEDAQVLWQSLDLRRESLSPAMKNICWHKLKRLVIPASHPLLHDLSARVQPLEELYVIGSLKCSVDYLVPVRIVFDSRAKDGFLLDGVLGDEWATLQVGRCGYFREMDWQPQGWAFPAFFETCKTLKCLGLYGSVPHPQPTSFSSELRELQMPYALQDTLSVFFGSTPVTTLYHLVNLNVRACLWFDDAALGVVAKQCTKLERANLGCTGISAVGLTSLLRSSAKLTHLDLCYVVALQNKDASRLLSSISTAYAPNLLMIGIGGWSRLTDESLVQFCRENPLLQHLGIGGCTAISGDAIATLPLSHLRRYNDHNMNESVTDEHRKALFKRNPMYSEEKSDEEDWESLYPVP